MRTKLLLSGIAALLLATGAAHAATPWTHTGDENCVVVRKTPDGFLSVREKPTVKSKVIAVLRPGFPLTVRARNQFLDGEDTSKYKTWTRWTWVSGWFTSEDADPSYGWVYSKYIKKVPCVEGEPNEDGGADHELSKEPEVDINPSKQETIMPDEMLADWCKRNDPNLTAQSCIELKSETHIKRPCWPKWVGLKER